MTIEHLYPYSVFVFLFLFFPKYCFQGQEHLPNFINGIRLVEVCTVFTLGKNQKWMRTWCSLWGMTQFKRVHTEWEGPGGPQWGPNSSYLSLGSMSGIAVHIQRLHVFNGNNIPPNGTIPDVLFIVLCPFTWNSARHIWYFWKLWGLF